MKKTGFLLFAPLASAIHSALCEEAGAPPRLIAFVRDSGISNDGKRLLININMDEDVSLKDWEGPLPAIWLFDIPSGQATRLTPKKSYASDSCWLNDFEFLVVDADKKGKRSSIYRALITGGTPRLIVKNAADPSVSRE